MQCGSGKPPTSPESSFCIFSDALARQPTRAGAVLGGAALASAEAAAYERLRADYRLLLSCVDDMSAAVEGMGRAAEVAERAAADGLVVGGAEAALRRSGEYMPY